MDLRDTILEGFASRKVAVIGDAVADQFLRGNIDRVSREAPVFILKHEETETHGGGAANTASNVASLGAGANLVGVIGEDTNGERLVAALEGNGVNCSGVCRTRELETTTKVRILAGQHYAGRQQVIRVDYVNESPSFDTGLKESLVAAMKEAVEGSDAVILSDYGYGIADILFEVAIDSSSDKPVLIDSRHRLQDFPGATAATPNKEEIERILGSHFEPGSMDSLKAQLGVEHLLVTLGNQGMCLASGEECLSLPVVGSDQPVDVTGAGDTVISVFALGLASGLDAETSSRVANHAGGIVVMKQGTATVTARELVESIEEHEPQLFSR